MSFIKTLKSAAGVFNMLAPFISSLTGGKVNLASVSMTTTEKVAALRGVLDEVNELALALEEALTPDADGNVRITEAEIDSIVDQADDVPGAVAKLVKGGGATT